MSTKPTDLDATRQAEIRDMEAAVARGGRLPTWAEIIIARATREGFAGPYNDPDDDLAEFARAWAKLSPRLRAIAAEAMRKGFAARPDDDDGPRAA